MKTIVKLLFLSLLFVSLSCSKYEEGSYFTLKTKMNRITNTWKPVKYYYPNGSSTSEVDEGLITLRKDGSASLQLGEGDLVFNLNGTWNFINDKEGVNVYVSALGQTSNENYEIVKLTSKVLKVRDKNDTVIEYEAID